MRAGSNSKVDSKAPSKGRPRSKPSSKKWFGMLANRPHRLRNFLFYKEKNSEDTTNDEVHSWRRDPVGLTFFCASANAQAKEKKMNEALTINGDGAQRSPDIHWPKGQHPEDDLYAHNEIMVNASCETVFAN